LTINVVEVLLENKGSTDYSKEIMKCDK